MFTVHFLFILFGVLHRFQHCTGHITMGNWKGRGKQYIEFARVLYCKLPTNSKQLPAFPIVAVPGIEPRPQRWEFTVQNLDQLLVVDTCLFNLFYMIWRVYTVKRYITIII